MNSHVHILLRDESTSKAIDFMCSAYGFKTHRSQIESVQVAETDSVFIVAETSRFSPQFADFRVLRDRHKVDPCKIIVLSGWNNFEIEAHINGVTNLVVHPAIDQKIISILQLLCTSSTKNLFPQTSR